MARERRSESSETRDGNLSTNSHHVLKTSCSNSRPSTLTAPLKKSYLASVTFLNLGNELACGSPSGDIPTWDAVTGLVQQTLSHIMPSCHICLPILLYPSRSPCTGYLRRSILPASNSNRNIFCRAIKKANNQF
jgi:hypothetical protein